MAYLLNQPYQRAGKIGTWIGDCSNGDGVRGGSFMLCEAVDYSLEKEDLKEYIKEE